MKAVWSLWTQPLRASSHPGWLCERHHALSWILSWETARRHYPDTCLITDTPGAAWLVDQLGLRFAEVRVDLDDLTEQQSDWWAMGKLCAYAQQTTPFVHIDSDVYLWKPLPERLEQAALFAQNPEWHTSGRSFYRPEWFEHWVGSRGGWLPEELTHYVHPQGVLRAENCGILGGTRVDFITHYARQALDIIRHPSNRPLWPALEHKDAHFVLIEQYFMAACVEFYRDRPGSELAGVAIDYLFPSQQAALRDAEQAGFTHLIAGAKRHADTLQRLERHVCKHYPQAYRRCLEVTDGPVPPAA